jgi:choline-sulfatase
LRTGAAAALSAFAPWPAAAQAPARPNFLLILCDQLHIDAISRHGNPHLQTPNIDRLIRRGTSFRLSHSANPICCPARSCLLTGRMSSETGVIANGIPECRALGVADALGKFKEPRIVSTVPNLGQWFEQYGYETVYCGKWHLPNNWAPNDVAGFTVLPEGGGEGSLADPFTARGSVAYLQSRSGPKPFVLISSFLQPHDIAYWSLNPKDYVPEELPLAELKELLPPLPANHLSRPLAPKVLEASAYKNFSEEQWRYYLYCYYRQVEMMDAELGRLLDGLEASPHADDTVVIFTSDHGEGAGHHLHVQKWYPYDEALKVPFILSAPGRAQSGVLDTEHLVSGVDVASTMCDYAGIPAPPHARGLSLRPLVEGRAVAWREFVPAEVEVIGRVIRTMKYKYVQYRGDPIEQLFDMQSDPGETRNVYAESQYAGVIADHRKLLKDWESELILA